MTPLKKAMPYNKNMLLNRLTSNTGHTNGCQENSYTVIYRFEEWIKVFIHETFHSFGMDFNQMERGFYYRSISNLFNVNVDVKFYEAYCEVWCKIINCILEGIMSLKLDKVREIQDREKIKHKDAFFRCFIKCMNLELSFGIFQGVKMLRHYDMKYSDLYNRKEGNKDYEEETNILAYHIITPGYLLSIDDFMKWAKDNNCLLYTSPSPRD